MKWNLLNWFYRRHDSAIAENLDRSLTEGDRPETTNVCHLRLVEPATVTREDFGDKFDKVIEATEGDDG